MRNWKLFQPPKPPIEIEFGCCGMEEGYQEPISDPWGLGWAKVTWTKPLLTIPALPDILPFPKSRVAWLVSSLLLPLFVRAHYEERSVDLMDYLPKTEEEMERILIAMHGVYNE